MFNRFIKKHQAVFIGLGIFALMMLAVFSIGLGAFNNQHKTIYALSAWFRQHHALVLLWHVLILISIYFGWGFKVNHALKTGKIDKNHAVSLRRIRWFLIVVIIVIDFVVFF